MVHACTFTQFRSPPGPALVRSVFTLGGGSRAGTFGVRVCGESWVTRWFVLWEGQYRSETDTR